MYSTSQSKVPESSTVCEVYADVKNACKENQLKYKTRKGRKGRNTDCGLFSFLLSVFQ